MHKVNEVLKVKKKNIILGILSGFVIFGSGVGAATYFSAKDISFTPTNSEWTVTNVEEAVNDLYELKNTDNLTLLWTNPDITAAFAPQIVSLDITKYDYFIIEAFYHYYSDRDMSKYIGYTWVPTDNMTKFYQLSISVEVSDGGGGHPYRRCQIVDSGIQFYSGHSSESSTNNLYHVPTKIYGVNVKVSE